MKTDISSSLYTAVRTCVEIPRYTYMYTYMYIIYIYITVICNVCLWCIPIPHACSVVYEAGIKRKAGIMLCYVYIVYGIILYYMYGCGAGDARRETVVMK